MDDFNEFGILILFPVISHSFSSTLAKNSNKVSSSILDSSIEEIEDLNSIFGDTLESATDSEAADDSEVAELSASETNYARSSDYDGEVSDDTEAFDCPCGEQSSSKGQCVAPTVKNSFNDNFAKVRSQAEARIAAGTAEPADYLSSVYSLIHSMAITSLGGEITSEKRQILKEEMVSAAIEAVLLAIPKFDSSKGNFPSFIGFYIIEAFRKVKNAAFGINDNYGSVAKYADEFYKLNGYKPSAAEIKAHMDEVGKSMSEKNISENLMGGPRQARNSSDGDEVSFLDNIADAEPDDFNDNIGDFRLAVNFFSRGNTELNNLVETYFFKCRDYSVLAKKFGGVTSSAIGSRLRKFWSKVEAAPEDDERKATLYAFRDHYHNLDANQTLSL